MGRDEREEDVDKCIYDGYLMNEKDVYVTMAGCINSDNFQVSLKRLHYVGLYGDMTNLDFKIASAWPDQSDMKLKYHNHNLLLYSQILLCPVLACLNHKVSYKVKPHLALNITLLKRLLF